MHRTLLIVAGALSASSLLLVDSAIKGTALLASAAVAAILLRRDSAATRHLVWLLAMVALLATPVLSAMLPHWRVLPGWTSIPSASSEEPITAPSDPRPTDNAIESPQVAERAQAERPTAVERATATPDAPPVVVRPQATAASAVWSWNWQVALPLLWAIGCGVLILRLAAARWMLWNAERHSAIIGSSRQPEAATKDPLVAALCAVCLQLGIRRPVHLAIHPDETIPVVWGILRCRLLLPAAARQWSGEQLRSVLLHELAHVKRHDAVAQLLAQIACAVHWFNPLAWFAAWRLGVERERACDDLVLASGVRPSAYASHLLEVVEELSPARWTEPSGLAMARRSSLESRLAAVLGKDLNRRGVSLALAAVALTIAVSIAVPLAMLRAQEEKPSPVQAPQKPKGDGAQLQPATEQKLKWGEPAGGLRMALAWPPTLGEPALGDTPEFYLVVQNVSPAAVRLTINDAAPNPRRLLMRSDGRPLQAIRDEQVTPGDWLLAPREAVFLPLFQSAAKPQDERAEDFVHETSAAIEESVRKFPQYSVTADMSIEKAPAGAWTGKLSTGQSRGSVDVIPPKHKAAQALYQSWTTAARADGKIPGGLVGQLADSVKTFIKNNPTWNTTPQLKEMLPRLDASGDWSGQEVVALLDELVAVQDTPIKMALDHEQEHVVRTGAPLPPQMADAPWGEALPTVGLRLAYLLEPRAAEHALGTPLKGRILIHNAGKSPVVFRTRQWHQPAHGARDASGAEIKTESTSWTTIGRLVPFRLAPGEFVELRATGIGVGANTNSEDWQNTRVGTWIEANAGDEATLSTDPIPLSDWNERPDLLGGEPRWWLDFIKQRLSRHLPFPADEEARKLLLYRIAMELFGTPVSAEINAAFVADREPTALDSLAERLFHRPGQLAWAGPLQSAPTTFRVLPADPDAAKRPRTASNPGRYTLGEGSALVVTRRPVGERIVNEAHLSLPAGKRHEITLPDGYGTWAAAWVRGNAVMWITQKGLLRKFDFTDLAKVEETRFQADEVGEAPIPPDIRKALIAALAASEAPTQQQERRPPPAASPPATPKSRESQPPDDALWKTKVPLEKIPVQITNWSAEKDGLRIGMRVVADEGWRIGGNVKVELWLHNASAKRISFNANPGRPDVGLSVWATDADGQDHWAESGNISIVAVPQQCTLPAGHVAKVKDFTLSFDAPDNQVQAWMAPRFRKLQPGNYQLRCRWSDAHPIVSGPGDWTGEMTTSEVDFTLGE